MQYEVTVGDKYRHYKGGIYDYIGVTVDAIEVTETPDHAFNAIYSEDIEVTIKVYQFNYKKGIKFYAPNYPSLVIYKDQDDSIWARPAEMFFGYLDDGRKRFTLFEKE